MGIADHRKPVENCGRTAGEPPDQCDQSHSRWWGVVGGDLGFCRIRWELPVAVHAGNTRASPFSEGKIKLPGYLRRPRPVGALRGLPGPLAGLVRPGTGASGPGLPDRGFRVNRTGRRSRSTSSSGGTTTAHEEVTAAPCRVEGTALPAHQRWEVGSRRGVRSAERCGPAARRSGACRRCPTRPPGCGTAA